MPTVKIKDLGTEKELIYTSMTVEQALINAHEYQRGNFNTWDYPSKPQLKIKKHGNWTIMGDLVAEELVPKEEGNMKDIEQLKHRIDELEAREIDYICEIDDLKKEKEKMFRKCMDCESYIPWRADEPDGGPRCKTGVKKADDNLWISYAAKCPRFGEKK